MSNKEHFENDVKVTRARIYLFTSQSEKYGFSATGAQQACAIHDPKT